MIKSQGRITDRVKEISKMVGKKSNDYVFRIINNEVKYKLLGPRNFEKELKENVMKCWNCKK